MKQCPTQYRCDVCVLKLLSLDSWTMSIVWYSAGNNVSENGCLALRWKGWVAHTQSGSLEEFNLSKWIFGLVRILGDGQDFRNPVAVTEAVKIVFTKLKQLTFV